ncbi:uncharacterized protein C8R40DRAFT_1219343 [Lentinula edodes]|uniref:uncharacterized protein n=1 Tax=Lentinula edodes TaxID=5353 RepID=UPI001E8D33AC|nr:uncharacterized protein C8R40DRAFT_1219343 [Lentinula edodes]KAH7878675.1 hypothetical protein C8R40DRAFT_1219343 [Lentinula edodes]
MAFTGFVGFPNFDKLRIEFWFLDGTAFANLLFAKIQRISRPDVVQAVKPDQIYRTALVNLLSDDIEARSKSWNGYSRRNPLPLHGTLGCGCSCALCPDAPTQATFEFE